MAETVHVKVTYHKTLIVCAIAANNYVLHSILSCWWFYLLPYQSQRVSIHVVDYVWELVLCIALMPATK